jgi:pimeloyl-ACP methyl ester carboxylesterase
MAERLAEAVARRGGPPINVLAWSWNGATYINLNARVNAENNLSHGRMLAAALWASGVPPSRTHLIGHSAGAIVAASSARTLNLEYGHPVAQLTLLDPAAYYHHVIFDRLAAGTSAGRVENYWAPAPSGYGRAVTQPGVRNVRVDGQTPWLGVVAPIRSAHLDVVRWYLATVEDRTSATGFNASVSAN